MRFIFSKIILTLILTSTIIVVKAQKIYYSQGNKYQKQVISEDTAELIYSVYLIGDIKDPRPDNKVLKLLKHNIDKESSKSVVVILGDIVYPLGSPDSTDKGFVESEKDLNHILNTFDSFKGELIFLPGNHDWAKGKQQGWESVKRQEIYIEQYNNRGNLYLPDEGCPGPVEVELSDDITLIVFDSQWWFQKNEKPGIDEDCDITNEAELFIHIEDALRRNRDKKVIFASHHPLYSVGKHGGHFPASYLLFPLLEVKDWMYIPLPGFIYTGYRKYLGNIQDLAHPEYKIFIESLTDIFKDYPNVIYAAAHEHNLQYLEKDSLHHIISGGGGEATYISKKKKKADFASQSTGVNKLSFYSNGNVWMEFICPDSTSNGKTTFVKKLYNKPIHNAKAEEIIYQKIDFSDSVVHVKISDIYSKNNFHRFWMGDNYRDIWNTEVELPVFDIGTEKGGLNILQRGGGQQTKSVRLEDKDGKQFVLRSVNKYVEKALAEKLQNTIVVDIVQDIISASHPYSAITVPNLAAAAGVMHTNPKIVWVPDDPRLGIYQEDLANGVFLFEERPANNRDDVPSFNRSKEIVNTAAVVKETQNLHNHKVDQNSVVRARLFDILINDWDRHDDQWRWATTKEGKNTIYRPIPRDRDQVYFVNNGIVIWIASRNWAMRKLQGFDYTTKDVIGLGYNARYFDRSFITEPGLHDWVSIATDIKNNVTDSVIETSIKTLPENVYAKSGLEIENKLKSRRDLLPQRAEEYYRFLSKNVDIVGTNDRELFDVVRQDNGNTKVTIYELSNKKGKTQDILYSRDFKYGETKEIRLYGLDGKDYFQINGQGKKGIKLRIIGGKGNDSIVDNSKVSGLGKKTFVYDRKDKKNEIVKSSETKLHLSKNKSINTYNRKQFHHNKTIPAVAGGYNIDDGIFIRGGVNINRYNFRDSTFHKIRGTLAFQTGAFGISYEGLFTSISQILDMEINASVSFPLNVDNFYGLGNDTKKITKSKKYYRVRYSYAWFNPMLKHTVSSNFHYSFGAFYQYFKVTDTANRFIGDAYPKVLDSSTYLAHHYTGAQALYKLDTRDNDVMPTRGIVWETQAQGFYSISDKGENFIKIRSDLSFYLSFRKDPRVVFALRFGGAANIGDYQFYHANFLGGKTNLRGFRSNRYAGDQLCYQNTEIRFKLMNLKSYVFNGQTGIIVFNDIGRVWVAGENSKVWHNGYGIGIWVAPFDYTALTVTFSSSKQENLLDFTFRFMF
jgi:hypothetical protein